MNSSAIHKLFHHGRGFALIILILWILGVLYAINPIINDYRFITLHKILKAGQITVITRNTPHCYYSYRDEPMGFEYDLAQEFAEYLGVELKIKIAENWKRMLPELKSGTAAVIAAGITITPKRQKRAAFSDGYMDIRQHIISHRNNPKIKNVSDLSGKTVHVQTATAYQERLDELRRQGLDLSIELHRDLPTEELIQRVAEGDRRVPLLRRLPLGLRGRPVLHHGRRGLPLVDLNIRQVVRQPRAPAAMDERPRVSGHVPRCPRLQLEPARQSRS